MPLIHKPCLVITCLLALSLILPGNSARAQSIFLNPDTVRICSGETEEFELELRADELVTNMALYSAFIAFDTALLELNYTIDTTYWQCNAWTYDSICVDSPCVEWAYTDSICDSFVCIEWQLDSTAIDSLCTQWQYDSTAIDSTCADLILDSTCLMWQCEAYDTLGFCTDSICLIAEVDSTCIGVWEYTDWLVDSTCIGPWEYTAWIVDSLCLNYECIEYAYTDSTCIAYFGCNEWEYDSTCADSTETTAENADFLTEDTISHAIEEGPLMRDAPGAQSVMFYNRMTADSSALIIESVIFWPKMSVDGPGLLATIRLKNKGSGTVDLAFDSIRVLDIDAQPIPVDGIGSELIFNVPPDTFGLVLPVDGAQIEVDIGDSVAFSWETSVTHCPGDSVLYELIYSESSSFLGLFTHSVADINATTYRLEGNTDLWDGRVYWKVRSYNTLGRERYCTEDFRYFDVDITSEPPGSFSLLIPRHDSILNVIEKEYEFFQWTQPETSIPDDTLRYTLYLYAAPAERTPAEDGIVIDDLLLPETSVHIDSLELCVDYEWQVKCTNRVGLFTWSDEIFGAMFYMRGDANGDSVINVGDPVYLINYIFKNGPAPLIDLMGDANCDDAVNIGDAVFLINYVFKGGPLPCSE